MNQSKIIPIFYACDSNYTKYAMVSMKSLIVNASKDYEYHIYILHTGIENQIQEQVKRLEEAHVSIIFVDVSAQLAEMEKKLPLRDYYSLTTYYRLFIADMFPEIDKAIYIDSDTVVPGDISELYAYDLQDNYVAGVRDQVVIQNEIFSDYVEKVLGIDRDKYFNAGMLLMNCAVFREECMLDQFVNLLNAYTFVVAQDQDYLNIICQNRVLWLDAKWNCEIFGEIPCKEDFKIIHYNLASKPWHYKEDFPLAEYFWKYAAMTEEYQTILTERDQYSEEEKEADNHSGDNLVQLAINEINNENNYMNIMKDKSGKAKDRLEVLDRIAKLEQEGKFDVDVEMDPPAETIMPDEIDYLNKTLGGKLRTRYAYKIGRWFLNMLIYKKKLIIKEVKGIENFRKLHTGAVITCNHFNAFDSFAMQIAYDKSWHRRRKMFKIIKEGNYTSFPGFYGFLMRNCNTLPLSSNYETMKKFVAAVDRLLTKGHFVLIYPEQSMWWNYKKPKPLKKGAFTFASRNNVPVLPCFITMEDSDIMGDDGFYVQEYTIHIAEPIYPDPEKSRPENAEMMRRKNYEIWKQIYEKTYQVPLEYTCGQIAE